MLIRWAASHLEKGVGMRYEYGTEETHIFVEEGETEQQVLRAIVKSTFETAAGMGMGILHYNRDTLMTDELADRFIELEDAWVVRMDYVEGRQVKTSVDRVESGHFVLYTWAFERNRGDVKPMLGRVQELLRGAEATGQASTMHMFKGQSLDLRLRQFGFERQRGETDWEFRKRIFPDLFAISSDEGIMYLFGGTVADLQHQDKLLIMLMMRKSTSRADLIQFANDFTVDPLEHREWLIANT